jgi:hypothetical protein
MGKANLTFGFLCLNQGIEGGNVRWNTATMVRKPHMLRLPILLSLTFFNCLRNAESIQPIFRSFVALGSTCLKLLSISLYAFLPQDRYRIIQASSNSIQGIPTNKPFLSFVLPLAFIFPHRSIGAKWRNAQLTVLPHYMFSPTARFTAEMTAILPSSNTRHFNCINCAVYPIFTTVMTSHS